MNEFMNFMVENGLYLFGLALCCVVIALHIAQFFEKPSKEQLACLKNWLIGAVIEAEEAFGSDTGVIKLRYVYDKFIERFPWLIKLISFEQFSDYVDEALVEMEQLLVDNKTIRNRVKFGNSKSK